MLGVVLNQSGPMLPYFSNTGVHHCASLHQTVKALSNKSSTSHQASVSLSLKDPIQTHWSGKFLSAICCVWTCMAHAARPARRWPVSPSSTADVLSEEAILKWYTEAHLAKGKSVFLEQMKKFVEWLKNAEEGTKNKHTHTHCPPAHSLTCQRRLMIVPAARARQSREHVTMSSGFYRSNRNWKPDICD